MSICLTVHWLFSFVFTFATPYMISGTGVHGWVSLLSTALVESVVDYMFAGNVLVLLDFRYNNGAMGLNLCE